MVWGGIGGARRSGRCVDRRKRGLQNWIRPSRGHSSKYSRGNRSKGGINIKSASLVGGGKVVVKWMEGWMDETEFQGCSGRQEAKTPDSRRQLRIVTRKGLYVGKGRSNNYT